MKKKPKSADWDVDDFKKRFLDKKKKESSGQGRKSPEPRAQPPGKKEAPGVSAKAEPVGAQHKIANCEPTPATQKQIKAVEKIVELGRKPPAKGWREDRRLATEFILDQVKKGSAEKPGARPEDNKKSHQAVQNEKNEEPRREKMRPK